MLVDNLNSNNHVEHGSTVVDDVRNNFVFHNNQEFIDFQRCFVLDDAEPYLPIFKKIPDVDFQFYSSSECDHISLTFMYDDGKPYQIINNKALFFNGFKNIVIQGSRSEHTLSQDVPTLMVYNECEIGATKYKNSLGGDCFSYDCDDAIFNIQNQHNSPVNVVISDIAFSVAFNLNDVQDAKLYERWYHPDICPVFFKVYEASSFKMYNVRMYSQYLDLTHVFLHWCENVDITNCEFKNYNARKIGGNLWLCQRAKNVNIVNNDFYKYGNDENIGIWGDAIMSRDEENCYSSKESLTGLDDVSYANRQLDFNHIHIKNNRFFYGKPKKPLEALQGFSGSDDTDNKPTGFPDNIKLGKIHNVQKEKFEKMDSEEEWEGVIDIFQNLYISQHTQKTKFIFTVKRDNTGGAGSAIGDGTVAQFASAAESAANVNKESAVVPYVHYKISDYVIDGNEFYIDSPVNVLLGMTFDNYCRTEGIKITNNLIKYGSWAHMGCQLQDFKVVFDKNPDVAHTCYGLQMTNKKCLSPIYIEDNTIESVAYPYMMYENSDNVDEYHIVLNVENANVAFNRNTVDEDIKGVSKTISKNNIKNGGSNGLGYMLLYSRDKGGRVSMNENVFIGMMLMGSFDMQNSLGGSEVELVAANNLFQGGTTFYSKNLQAGLFNFVSNQFFAENFVLLLQEMPKKTLLVLRGNTFKKESKNENGVDGEVANLYYSNLTEGGTKLPLPDSMTIVSSGNMFENIKGRICPEYEDLNVQIYSSNEHPIDRDFCVN